VLEVTKQGDRHEAYGIHQRKLIERVLSDRKPATWCREKCPGRRNGKGRDPEARSSFSLWAQKGGQVSQEERG
jgi:hypothetical protein